MARDLDDDAPARLRRAEEELIRVQQELGEHAARRLVESGDAAEAVVRDTRQRMARRRLLAWTSRLAMAVAVGAVVVAVAGTLANHQQPARFATADTVCAALLLLAVAALIVITVFGNRAGTPAELSATLTHAQRSLRAFRAETHPPLGQRRKMYREEVHAIIEQYQADSRRYRRVHNTLQSLIMVGSAATTGISAFSTGSSLTWQSISLTAISFAITLAAAFTGYYKYRERAYFLQQTADDIEKEANAVTLGIGPYGRFDPDQEQEALQEFTQRVEDLRNEQRRRQQQLDQPAEQAAQPTPSSS